MLVLVTAAAVFCISVVIVLAIDAFRWREMGRLWRIIKVGSVVVGLGCAAVWLSWLNPGWQLNLRGDTGFDGKGWWCNPYGGAGVVCFRERPQEGPSDQR